MLCTCTFDSISLLISDFLSLADLFMLQISFALLHCVVYKNKIDLVASVVNSRN